MRRLMPLVAAVVCLMPSVGWCDRDLDLVRKRMVETALSAGPRDGAVDKLLQTQKEDGSWPGINYQDVSNTGFQHTVHLANMVALAGAWRHSDSKYRRDRKVEESVEKALGFWVRNDFICENWWHNQIGTPNGLVNVMLLIGEALPPELVAKAQPMIGRAHLNATGARPSGDRIKIAGILAKNLVFLDDTQKFGEVIKVIESEIHFSTGPGLQADLSFHHRTDGVNNTLSYGMGYAEAFAEWAEYVAGTRHAFSEEKIRLLTDYYLDGICRHLNARGLPDPAAMNREISRPRGAGAMGVGIARKLLKAGDYRGNELKALISATEGRKVPSRSHCTSFWRCDYVTFRRPNYMVSVRMHSVRTHTMEMAYNSEGLLNHHRGDGASHVMLAGDEYADCWPAFDMQMIPGATIMRKKQLPPPGEVQKRGLGDFAGAATNGLIGVAGFDFKSPHDPLSAKKAWFFFDGVYVCLGAGITCSGSDPVTTTLNQCLLKGKVTMGAGRRKTVLETGEHTPDETAWILHDGIGYVFPERANVRISNISQSGSWFLHSQQSNSSKETLRIPMFKLWVDHGVKPQNAGYAYIVVPGTDAGELEKGTRTRRIVILENRPEVQAVRDVESGAIQMVFYQPGKVGMRKAMEISCGDPALVMLKVGSGTVKEITVADPTQKLARIRLTLPVKVVGTGEGYRANWDAAARRSDLTLDLPQGAEAGRSVTLRF